jgi:hypothetical protein
MDSRTNMASAGGSGREMTNPCVHNERAKVATKGMTDVPRHA